MAVQGHHASLGVTEDAHHRRSGPKATEAVTVPQSTVPAEFLHHLIMMTFRDNTIGQNSLLIRRLLHFYIPFCPLSFLKSRY